MQRGNAVKCPASYAFAYTDLASARVGTVGALQDQTRKTCPTHPTELYTNPNISRYASEGTEVKPLLFRFDVHSHTCVCFFFCEGRH